MSMMPLTPAIDKEKEAPLVDTRPSSKSPARTAPPRHIYPRSSLSWMGVDEVSPSLGQKRRKLLSKLGSGREQTQSSLSQVQAPVVADGGSSSAITSVVDSAKTGWSVLKRVLVTVRDASDLCPPLKASLVGVVELMDLVDVGAIHNFKMLTAHAVPLASEGCSEGL